jgi:hypothetical protein
MRHPRVLVILVDLIGLTIGGAGLAFSLIRGQYAAAVILAGIMAGLIFLVRRHLQGPSFRYHWLRHELVIHDDAGRRTSWRILSRLTPENRPLARFDDGRLTCSGRFVTARSNQGEVRLRHHAPGDVRARTVLRPALPADRPAEKELELEMEDAYTQPAEHHSWRPRYEMDYLEIVVHFPAGRRPDEVRGVMVEKGARRPLYNIERRDDDAVAALRVIRPRLGAEYRLEWHW